MEVTSAQETQNPPAPTAPQAQAPLIPKKENTVVGWLDVIPFTSKILHNTRMLRVWLPGNYWSPSNRARKYPVLYMQDGQNLFDKATALNEEWQMDETIDHLAGSFRIGPMVVVGIDNAGDKRSSEYLPYPDPLNPQPEAKTDLKGKEYAEFVVTEVLPFIQKKYHVAISGEGRAIGGSSYGATIALYTALKHPGVFGRVLLESPVLEVGEGQLLKDAQTAKALPQKMYIGVGTEDGWTPQVSDRLIKDVRELDKTLQARGMGPTRLKVVIEQGGTHEEAAWSKRLPEAMLFLYGR